MSEIILRDEDLSPEFTSFIMKNKIFWGDKGAKEYNDKHINISIKDESKPKPYLIIVDDKAVFFTNELNESQTKMIQLTELYITARAKGFAIQRGWTKDDFNNIGKMGSESFLNFKLIAVQELNYLNLFHAEFISNDFNNNSYGAPVIECILNIASTVSNAATSPVSTIINNLLSGKAVKENAKNIMDKFWEATNKNNNGAIFDISPAWKHDGCIAKTISASSSNMVENDWNKFLVTKRSERQKFYSAAFAYTFLENTYKVEFENQHTHMMESWQQRLEDLFAAQNAKYFKSFNSTDLFFD